MLRFITHSVYGGKRKKKYTHTWKILHSCIYVYMFFTFHSYIWWKISDHIPLIISQRSQIWYSHYFCIQWYPFIQLLTNTFADCDSSEFNLWILGNWRTSWCVSLIYRQMIYGNLIKFTSSSLYGAAALLFSRNHFDIEWSVILLSKNINRLLLLLIL